MRREAIVELVETYVHASAGWQAARVERVVRYWNADDRPEALVLVTLPARNGDPHQWCIRVGIEDGALAVQDDSLPASELKFVQERM